MQLKDDRIQAQTDAAALGGSGQATQGAEDLGEGGQGDEVVPAVEAAALEVDQSQGLLELAVVVLDARA